MNPYIARWEKAFDALDDAILEEEMENKELDSPEDVVVTFEEIRAMRGARRIMRDITARYHRIEAANLESGD